MRQQWSPALTSDSYRSFTKSQSAKSAVNKETVHPFTALPAETIGLAQKLALELPAADWTIEVDVLGRHRITIHFKGIGVSIDE